MIASQSAQCITPSVLTPSGRFSLFEGEGANRNEQVTSCMQWGPSALRWLPLTFLRFTRKFQALRKSPQFSTLTWGYSSRGVKLHMWKSCIKHFVAPREAACNLINCLQWLRCIVGNVGSRLWKAVHGYCEPEISLFYCMHSSSILKPVAYITHNASSHHWRQFIQLHAASSGSTKDLTLFI